MHRIVIILLIFSCLSVGVEAQTVGSLKSEIERAEREIAATNKMLSDIKNQKRSSERELKLVRTKITQRKSIVSNLEKQRNIIGGDIDRKSQSVSRLEGSVGEMKDEYAKMIYNAYKHYRMGNYLAFIFSAKDFGDIYRRVYYIKQYTQMRKKKAEELMNMSQELQAEVIGLNVEKSRLDSVTKVKNREINNLSTDETQYKGMVGNLNKQQGKLSKDLQNKRTQVANLQRKIQQIIAEEAKKLRKQTPTQTQEMIVLSGKFDQNMGKLPFPVSGGVIVDSYGVHPHPTQAGLQIDNKGINIAAGSRAQVRSVFDGEVSRIFFFKGLNNTVMIRHGSYISVYSNLQNVNVKTGDKIAVNQVIGVLADDDNAELHFEIWRESENLNPSKWLRR